MMLSLLKKLIFWVLFALTGCATYQAVPITPMAVKKALRVPAQKDLVLAASRFKHPILKPVKLNLKDGISPDEAAILAVLLNPVLRARRDGLGIARAQVIQAGILPNPQLSAGVDAPVAGIGTSVPYSVGLGFDLRALITRNARREAAGFRLKQVNMSIAWAEMQVAFAARRAVFRVIATQDKAGLQQKLVEGLKKNLDTVQEAASKGLMTALDLAAAQNALNTALSDLLELQKNEELQILRLKSLIGLPVGFKIVVQRGARPADPDGPQVQTGVFRNIDTRRLDLIALKYGYKSQEAGVRAAILGQFPNINIGVNHARDNSDYYSVGFGVSIDLPIFDRNQGHIAIQRATRKELFDEYTARVFRARADIARLKTLNKWLDRQTKQVAATLPQLERLLNTYKRALDQGQADLLTYYETYNRVARQKIRLIELKEKMTEARLALALAAGYYDIPSQKRKK